MTSRHTTAPSQRRSPRPEICLAFLGDFHQAAGMPETPSSSRPTGDLFADEVLPIIGLPSLHDVLQLNCPMLSPHRIDQWVARFNQANAELDCRFSDEQNDATEEEQDGIWYDHMKSIALVCLTEIDDQLDNETHVPRRNLE